MAYVWLGSVFQKLKNEKRNEKNRKFSVVTFIWDRSEDDEEISFIF